MLVELAFGIEPPTSIASRYGYSQTAYDDLTRQSWFQKALKAKQAELTDGGWNFKSKMGMLAEDLLTDAYVSAKASESATVKLEVAKYLTRIAELEPKEKFTATAGTGFQININLGSNNNQEIPLSKDVLDVSSGSLDELPPIPDYGVAVFPVNNELIGAQL
jgi:hypothetical protein